MVDFSIRVRPYALISAMIADEEFVDGPALAVAIRQAGGKRMPSDVLDYLCRFLDGSIPNPRGRKPITTKLARTLRDQRLVDAYRFFLHRLQARVGRSGNLVALGPDPDNLIDGGPPNELAARLAARLYGLPEKSWRTIQNRASKLKRPGGRSRQRP